MFKRRSFEHSYVAAIAVCVLGAVSSVQAADSGPYAAWDLGWAQYPQKHYTVVSSEAVPSPATVLTNSARDWDRLGWSVSGGYRFNRHVSVEASFVDLGSVAGPLTNSAGLILADPQLQLSTKGETLAAVAMLPLGRWNPLVERRTFSSPTLSCRSAGKILRVRISMY
jgi:hypothetical protein